MGIKSKIISVAALTALSTSVLAGGPEQTPASVCGPFDGFYLGVTGGWSSMKVRDHSVAGSNANPLAPGASFFPGVNIKTTASTFAVGGVAGYGKVLQNKFYFGVEVHGSYHDENASANYAALPALVAGIDSVSLRYNEDWDWGIDFMPGYVYNSKILFYGKVGYRGSRLKINTALSRQQPAGPLIVFPAVSTSRYINGANLGAGIKYAVYQNVNIWVEYDYTWYYRINNTANFAGVSALFVSHSIRKDYQQVLFGVSYNLCGLI